MSHSTLAKPQKQSPESDRESLSPGYNVIEHEAKWEAESEGPVDELPESSTRHVSNSGWPEWLPALYPFLNIRRHSMMSPTRS